MIINIMISGKHLGVYKFLSVQKKILLKSLCIRLLKVSNMVRKYRNYKSKYILVSGIENIAIKVVYILALLLTDHNEYVLTMPFDNSVSHLKNAQISSENRRSTNVLQVYLNFRRISTKRLCRTQKVTKTPFLRRFRVLYNDRVANRNIVCF